MIEIFYPIIVVLLSGLFLARALRFYFGNLVSIGKMYGVITSLDKNKMHRVAYDQHVTLIERSIRADAIHLFSLMLCLIGAVIFAKFIGDINNVVIEPTIEQLVDIFTYLPLIAVILGSVGMIIHRPDFGNKIIYGSVSKIRFGLFLQLGSNMLFGLVYLTGYALIGLLMFLSSGVKL